MCDTETVVANQNRDLRSHVNTLESKPRDQKTPFPKRCKPGIQKLIFSTFCQVTVEKYDERVGRLVKTVRNLELGYHQLCRDLVCQAGIREQELKALRREIAELREMQKERPMAEKSEKDHGKEMK